MSESNRKERIVADLQRAKETGELTPEIIRHIVKNEIAQISLEAQENRSEIAKAICDTIEAVIETLQEQTGDIQAEVTASIEGAIEGIGQARREKIVKTQSEINSLEGKLIIEQQELQQNIDRVLTEVQTQSHNEPDKVKQAIIEAISTISNSEEFALLQQQYVRLKAQIAILQANLANRYGEQYEAVNKHLDEAKNWYEKAKEDPEVFTEPVKQKQAQFDRKLAEAGIAIARKEKEVKNLLQELWHSVKDMFHDK
jgi:hypothetical protein